MFVLLYLPTNPIVWLTYEIAAQSHHVLSRHYQIHVQAWTLVAHYIWVYRSFRLVSSSAWSHLFCSSFGMHINGFLLSKLCAFWVGHLPWHSLRHRYIIDAESRSVPRCYIYSLRLYTFLDIVLFTKWRITPGPERFIPGLCMILLRILHRNHNGDLFTDTTVKHIHRK